VTVLVSIVTAPAVRASSLPCTVALVVAVVDAKLMMLPTKRVVVPRVAELPTCQKTLHAWAPLISLTRLLEAVVSVDPIWKMKTESGSPWPLRVKVPVIPADEEKQ
jgi:hypothetical protein